MEKHEDANVTTAQQSHSKLTRRLFRVKPVPVPIERTRNPKENAFILSRISWGWLSQLFYAGFSRCLEINDIWKINGKEAMEPIMADYRSRLAHLEATHSTNAHWRAIVYAIRWKFLLAATVTLFTFGAEVCLPVISRPTVEIIQKIYSGQSNDHGQAAGYAVGNTLVTLVWIYLQLWSGYYFSYIGQVVRGLLIAVIYDKTLKLSALGHSEYPASTVTSLITTDTTRIFAASRWTAQTLAAIPIGGAILGILIHYIGVSALPGFGLILVGCVASALSSKFISYYRAKSLPFADKRISAVTETIENMRILKYYGWESSYVTMIKGYREKEEGYLVKNGRVESINSSIISCVPYFAGLLAFAVRAVLGKDLDPARIFPALTLFLTFQPITQYFSDGLNAHADAYTSYKRLQKFFRADENSSPIPECTNPENVVEMESASFQWVAAPEPDGELSFYARWFGPLMFWNKSKKDHTPEKEPEKEPEESTGAKISCTKLTITRGELVMVVGPTGGGKSSLLSALIGAMPKLTGSLGITGELSTSMNNWSISGTIRDNILFGKDLNRQIYDKVVGACGLTTDFSNFENGDLTELGERGVNLSGGQKARISLARAVYHATDIVILDDVLSAVDAKVGREIFEHCIQEYMKNVTRIMSTNNPKILKYADQIIFMDKGKASVGTLLELQSIPEFKNLVKAEQEEEKDREIDEAIDEGVVEDEPTKDNDDDDLMDDENRARGKMDTKILLKYCQEGSGIWMVPAIILMLCLLGVARVMTSIFLSWWTSDKYEESRGWYIGIYAGIIGALCLVTILLEFMLCAFCLKASSGLHDAALRSIYRAPMSYFDTTPMGRIITRLTDDVAQLDMMIYIYMRMAFPGVTTFIAMLITVFVYLPWTILCVIPIIIFTAGSVYYYRISSREITRLASVFRSKMFTHVTESLGGLDVILGYKRGPEFEKRLFDLIDDFNSASFINTATQFWVGLRIMLSALPVTFVVTMLCAFQVFNLNPSTVAMILSLLPTTFITLATTMVFLVELEKEMNSVERVYELGFKIPQEGPYEVKGVTPGKEWPQSGAIGFKEVALRYRPGLPLVLNGLSLEIKPGEKFGICGRTGAGKSSLLTCLFRLAELDSGTLIIDGVDISKIGLNDLRRSLSIIPQDPVLFEGTIRSNLDPFREYTDADLWNALKSSNVHNSDTSETKFHLDSPVEAKGTNFSLGQRQLLTLARALVRNSKIIALDEATANVDHETDRLVQSTLNSRFKESTILCIAHRLSTILHYDRILVMDQGNAVELGTPLELYRKGGLFTRLCEESEITQYDIESKTVPH